MIVQAGYAAACMRCDAHITDGLSLDVVTSWARCHLVGCGPVEFGAASLVLADRAARLAAERHEQNRLAVG